MQVVKLLSIYKQDLVDKLHTNPKHVFGLPDQWDTYVEVDLETSWTIPKAMKYSKAQWTPFAGKRVVGMVKKVVLRGKTSYENEQVIYFISVCILVVCRDLSFLVALHDPLCIV